MILSQINFVKSNVIFEENKDNSILSKQIKLNLRLMNNEHVKCSVLIYL